MVERVPTGIDGLDEVIEGGLPKGRLILLAGTPGTGKTIFSSQFIVKGAEIGEPGVYVSFAEDRDVFAENVSTQLGVDLGGFEEEGKVKFMDLVTVKEKGVADILESILGEVELLKASRLVIDSFSALAQAFEKPIDPRIIVHTILNKIVHRIGCTTIIVVEVPMGESRIGLGLEEFVADGVIMLRMGEIDGRLVRDLEIVKLRGIELEERKLLFTLKGGFKAFPSFKSKPPRKPRRFKPIRDPPGKFSTGAPELDSILGGGIEKAGSILLEMGEKVSMTEYHLIIGPFVLNFAAQGRGVWVLPSGGCGYDLSRNLVLSYGLSEKEFQNLMLISDYRGEVSPEKGKLNLIQVKASNFEEDFSVYDKIINELRKRTGKPVLTIIGFDTLAILYGEDACEKILNMTVAKVRRHQSTAIFLVKPGREALVKRIIPIVDVHLRLIRERGCLLFYGVKPRTGLYVVEIDVSEGYPLPTLTPIV